MNDFIVRQFGKGDTFYIISKGRAKITKSASKWDTPKFVKYLNRGEYFGENALQGYKKLFYFIYKKNKFYYF